MENISISADRQDLIAFQNNLNAAKEKYQNNKTKETHKNYQRVLRQGIYAIKRKYSHVSFADIMDTINISKTCITHNYSAACIEDLVFGCEVGTYCTEWFLNSKLFQHRIRLRDGSISSVGLRTIREIWAKALEINSVNGKKEFVAVKSVHVAINIVIKDENELPVKSTLFVDKQQLQEKQTLKKEKEQRVILCQLIQNNCANSIQEIEALRILLIKGEEDCKRYLRSLKSNSRCA